MGTKLFRQLKEVHSPARYVGNKSTELTDIPLTSSGFQLQLTSRLCKQLLTKQLTPEWFYYSSQLPSEKPSCSVSAQVLIAPSLLQSQPPPASSPQLSLQTTIILPPGQQHAAAGAATPNVSKKPNETSLEYRGF